MVRAVPGFEFHILDADSRRIKGVRIVRDQSSVGQDDQAPASMTPEEMIALPAPAKNPDNATI